MISLVSAAIALALATAGVEAGSRAWESNVQLARTVEQAKLNARNTGYNASMESPTLIYAHAAQPLKKRWIGISTDGLYSLWPQGNIKACYERNMFYNHDGQRKDTKAILEGPLGTARDLWRAEGLHDDDGWFKWTFVEDDAYCTNRDNRPDFLLIMYSGVNTEVMATTPGIPARRDTSNPDTPFRDLGPRMMLSDSMNMGMMNVVPNYAHEMGHAWGLHHEHQNPDWWSEYYSGVARTKYFFGEDTFFCDRLSDYDTIMAKIDADNRYDASGKAVLKKKVCRNRDDAGDKQIGFVGAFNWLPVGTHEAQWEKKSEPDWKSIMLYPSICGGRGTGNAKAQVLLRKDGPNGGIIDPVHKPSREDVAGLKTLYKKKTSKKPKLFSEIGSKMKSLIDKTHKKNPDVGCI